eukprot:TRINITY_DN4537_c0_g1_i1.p1 TRINITY_DN4537_c0_g1~~TRINITY_DN4537_c0_g1_i1.p1  ORF type:complete len:284 (+),score=40.53 TRINITY_DN4537_c0_g1_i1:238-1089(+)
MGDERCVVYPKVLQGYLVLDAVNGTLSRPEDADLLEGWDVERVRRRKEICATWVEGTAKEELIRNFLGSRCFCFSKKKRKSVWVIDKGYWRKCRDHWLLRHILAFSTKSVRDGKMIGNLSDDELERLREEARLTSFGCLGERKCAFLALGLLINIEGGDLAGRLLRGMGKVGGGGATARSLKKFVKMATLVEGGNYGGITEWYCKGNEVWIAEVAAKKAGRKTRFDGEENGRWFLRLGEGEGSEKEEEETVNKDTEYYAGGECEEELSEEEKEDLHDLIFRDW